MRIDNIIRSFPPSFLDKFIQDNDHILTAVANYIEQQENITPPPRMIWDAFHLVSFDKECLFPNSLKVVIIFQDPYPQERMASGVAMSTTNGRIPSTLYNFHKRMKDTITDYPIPDLRSGDVRGLCLQGVLLLNASLTTEVRTPNAHSDAWSLFTVQLIRWMVDTFPFLVFVTLGRNAGSYADHITNRRIHPVITTSHPSGMGYKYGFNNCDIFNEVNEHLTSNGRVPIKWNDLHYV